MSLSTRHSSPRQNRPLALSLCALLILAVAACGSSQQPRPETGQQQAVRQTEQAAEAEAEAEAQRRPYTQVAEIRVGLLLPLSGPNESLGRAMLNAAQMAVFDVADDRFLLLVRDTGGTAEGARRAAENAIANGASLILGPVFSDAVMGTAQAVDATEINAVSFSNNRAVSGGNRYVMGLLPSAQILRVIDYAARQGRTRFAALTPDSPYGNTAIVAMQDAVRRSGGEIVRIVTYPAGSTNIGEQVKLLGSYDERRRDLERRRAELEARDDEASKLALKRLENLDTLGEPGFDALLIAETGSRLLAITPLLPYYDIDPETVQFLGTAQWDDPALAQREPALRGAWFAGPPPEPWAEFETRYRRNFRNAPPRLAALAYDATALAAVLARDAVPASAAQSFSDQQLTQPSGFAGVNGIFRLAPDGSVERGLAVLELREDRIGVLEPAPGDFRQYLF